MNGGFMKKNIFTIFSLLILFVPSVFAMMKTGASFNDCTHCKLLAKALKKAKEECSTNDELLSILHFDKNPLAKMKKVYDESGENAFLLISKMGDLTSLYCLMKNEKAGVESIKYLLSFKKVRELMINVPANFICNKSPLFLALSKHRLDIMKILVEHGALVCLDYLERMIDVYSDDVSDFFAKQRMGRSEEVVLAEKSLNRETFVAFKKWYKNDFLTRKLKQGTIECLDKKFFVDMSFEFKS
jgi:hypothetical protein